jgi:hypothetical protein
LTRGISLEAIELYIVSGSGWQGLGSFVAVGIVMLALARIGRLVPAKTPDLSLFVGWGVASLLLTLCGVVLKAPLYWAVLPLALLLAWSLRDRSDSENALARGRWRIAVMAAGFLTVSATSGVAGTDTFAYWLPNGWFLYNHDAFPTIVEPGLPYPAHPYNFQFIQYLTGLALPYFASTAMIAANGFLLVCLAALVAGVLRSDDQPSVTWPRATLCVLIATILNPTFVPALVFISYGDFATGVIVAAIGLAIARLADRQSSDDAHDWRPCLAIGLALAALINLKQSNLAQAGLLILGFAGLSLLDRRVSWRWAWTRLSPILAPPALIYLTWRHHVAADGLLSGENEMLPIKLWDFAILPPMLKSMGSVALNKGGFFGLVLILAARLAYLLVKRASDPARRLLLLALFQFVGFNLFLVITYIAVFSNRGGNVAQAYWRFSTQLGPLELLAFLYAFKPQIGALCAKAPAIVGRVAVPLCLIAPIAALPRLRIDVANQQGQLFSIGRELLATLPKGATLDIVMEMANWPASNYYLGVLRTAMVMTAPGRPDLTIRWHAHWQDLPPETSLVWVTCGNAPAVEATGLDDLVRQTALLDHRDGVWIKRQVWTPAVCR